MTPLFNPRYYLLSFISLLFILLDDPAHAGGSLIKNRTKANQAFSFTKPIDPDFPVARLIDVGTTQEITYEEWFDHLPCFEIKMLISHFSLVYKFEVKELSCSIEAGKSHLSTVIKTSQQSKFNKKVDKFFPWTSKWGWVFQHCAEISHFINSFLRDISAGTIRNSVRVGNGSFEKNGTVYYYLEKIPTR